MKPSRSNCPDDLLIPRDTNRSLPIALLRAREAVMSHFRPLLAAHDITEQQWRVVRTLGESGALDATELAARACLLAPSLTRIVRTLEDRGFVTRERDATDARRAVIRITTKGLDFIREVTPASRAIYAEMEAKLGRERIEALLDMLQDLNGLGAGNGS
ncbi:homoprotocatechuate degradation operon regulator HpaR [Aquibium sp. ELW1220]|jgi:homoprotocatechuate degradation regulator HpaR|uniref:homoprotocatechuate degradation operon regulator HpaR n=1 Tax=Aquibium sp. ELW1220 TaxID=2976766 RepID=UPI0025AF5592|nr:homoprotocatechuate degradation operon regulator HpaR [Aquibium sp. ELW1220]MDN2580273.1 homoprotocatechuate degradation operon regulator HpaR [Aquibium sp. ELW1220]